MTINLCFIKEEYFMQHSTFMNMLDPGNLNKRNHRTHLCLVVESDENKFYIPKYHYGCTEQGNSNSELYADNADL